MYFATPDRNSRGSTRLHKDYTSAMNLMVYCHDPRAGQATGATWTIFAREDAPALRKFLSDIHGNDERDLCHAQRVFVNTDMLLQLSKIGIKPFVVNQQPGQVVFIPAGCPHQVSQDLFSKHALRIVQVSNISSCIKIATDFVTGDCINYTQLVAREMRAEGLVDLIPVPILLWQAWQSLAGLRKLPHPQLKSSGKKRSKPPCEAKQPPAKRPHASSSGSLPTLRCPDPGCCDRTRTFDFFALRGHL